MMKKMLSLLIIGILGFGIINFGNKTIVAKNELDLFKMASVLEGENILFNEWSLYAREKVESFKSHNEVITYRDELKTKFPTWKWEESSNVSRWEARATQATKDGLVESIQILTTLTNKNLQTYIIYEAKSENNFNNDTESFLKKELLVKLAEIFKGNPTIFSCIKGEFSDNISKSLPYTVNHLLNAFQAKEIEALEEDSFISTSAYSPLFNAGLMNNNEDMNLQIGLRTQGLGAKTTFVVGTPIITIEY
ncbi:YwmB family TATA-box binding protein [Bacillus sp. 31A1R]|uniref:YwmB family TATA-box binding protein n=1 Tax=Robertmurraya mangrovi TaxID=3098077 RepID=A0ABU5IXE6_9BACI|nr:YwmB family TATA-box binding protein [Bacillus sp. 31A1R]MDZ5471830.1 YwmB family TATA-box binding protein [Bacillus sp. 31A1R]